MNTSQVSKPFWRSRLVWAGCAMMVLAFLIWTGIVPAQFVADVATIALFLGGVVVIVLRRFTNEPVHFI